MLEELYNNITSGSTVIIDYYSKDYKSDSLLETCIIGNDINTYFDEDSPRKDMKKMLVPTVVFIKNGAYIGLHFKTVDSQVNSTDELNKEQVDLVALMYQALAEYEDRFEDQKLIVRTKKI